MKIFFYGLRHGHIFTCFKLATAHPDIEILGAVEENEPARKAAQEALNYPVEADGYDKWLNNPEVDVVVIGGAYGNRGEAVIRALQHGKHVFADKPICTDMAQLEEIEALAWEKGLKVGCLLDSRDNPAARKAKEILQSGEMGEVRSISFMGQHCIDYAHRPSWYFEPGMHGGTFNDITIHALDLVHWMIGQKLGKIHCARTWNSFATKHPHFEDSAAFMGETDQGVALLADVSYAAPSQVFSMPTYWDYKFWCEKGLVTFCLGNSKLSIYRDGETEPEHVVCGEVEGNVLNDFYLEVKNDTVTFTEEVFAASEMALRLQQAATR